LILASGCTAVEKIKQPALYDEYEMDSGSAMHEAMPAPVPTQGLDSLYRSKGSESLSEGKEKSESIEQRIIKTASIKIEVVNVQQSISTIEIVAEENQGLIQSSSVYAGQNNQYSGSVTMRIPSSQFDGALSKISVIGKIISSSTSAEDVTEEYVDLAAQKTALTNQLEQYNRILTKAINVSEILEVQREIERVQVELDRIHGRIKYLDNRVSFSTITISLTEPAQVVTATGHSAASVISDGISGFIEMVVVIVVIIMTLLPLAILGGISYLIYRRWKNNQQG
jgi:hypothetical protein